MNPISVGVLGGGQLGRMMAEAAHNLGLHLIVLDPLGGKSPAGQIAHDAIQGSFYDSQKIRELAKQVDVLTIEIEHVDAHTLQAIADEGNIQVHPSPQTIAMIQDKYAQKVALQALDIPVPNFVPVNNLDEAYAAGRQFGYPYMLKSRRGAYDGKGNAVVSDEAHVEEAVLKLGGKNLYAEKWVNFAKELAVMVAKGKNEEGEGEDVIKVYPVVETSQKNSICHIVLAPASISDTSYEAVVNMASKAIASLHGRGMYGVELFLLPNDTVLLNEIAPRPHNSGHFTMEACETGQFEQHLRAVVGWPLGGTDLKVGASMMLNILGDPSASSTITFAPFTRSLNVPGATMHYYGKGEVRAGRKLGHLTVVASNLNQLYQRMQTIEPSLAASFSSMSDNKAVIGIIMGSDSDLISMKAAAEVMETFKVPYELTIVSAHRTPDRLFQYAKSAQARGLRVIIAGAGGAAHLPGMVAALTSLPVIGVPVKTSTFQGQDSLLSIVQMPRGVPVATVAIDNSMNAGLLAVRMLGVADAALHRAMQEFMHSQERQVHEKIEKIAHVGWQSYLDQM